MDLPRAKSPTRKEGVTLLHTAIFDVGGTLIGAPDLCTELAKLFAAEPAPVRDRLLNTLIPMYKAMANSEIEFTTIEDLIRETIVTPGRSTTTSSCTDRISMKTRPRCSGS